MIEIDALHVCKSRRVWPFFGAIALFVMLVLALARRASGRQRSEASVLVEAAAAAGLAAVMNDLGT
jgi:hypothetical protein